MQSLLTPIDRQIILISAAGLEAKVGHLVTTTLPEEDDTISLNGTMHLVTQVVLFPQGECGTSKIDTVKVYVRDQAEYERDQLAFYRQLLTNQGLADGPSPEMVATVSLKEAIEAAGGFDAAGLPVQAIGEYIVVDMTTEAGRTAAAELDAASQSYVKLNFTPTAPATAFYTGEQPLAAQSMPAESAERLAYLATRNDATSEETAEETAEETPTPEETPAAKKMSRRAKKPADSIDSKETPLLMPNGNVLGNGLGHGVGVL